MSANSTKTDVVPKRLLKVKAAADYLSIHPWSLRKLVDEQQLRVYRHDPHGAWLLDIRELDRFIDTHLEYI